MPSAQRAHQCPGRWCHVPWWPWPSGPPPPPPRHHRHRRLRLLSNETHPLAAPTRPGDSHPLLLSYDTAGVGWRLPRRTTGGDEFYSFGSAPRPGFRAEGPLHLNSGEEPLQHEAGAEGLSTPALNPCGTHRGARVQLWVGQAPRGAKQGSPMAVTGTPTRGHALAHWASSEGTRSSTAQQGGRRERRWRRDADKAPPLLLLGFWKEERCSYLWHGHRG
jgi:hypothetical protein